MKKIFVFWIAVSLFISTIFSANVIEIKADARQIVFTGYDGYEEGAYAEWQPVSGADGYIAYISLDGESFEAIDNELIRHYDDYIRVDEVGLLPGDYYIRVYAVTIDETGVATIIAGGVTEKLDVINYDRSGFAFSKDAGSLGTGSGAYMDDGTLREDAQVIYVTQDTAKTCTAMVNGVKYTGFQTILDAKKRYSQVDDSALDFRIIGCVSADDMDHFSNANNGLQVRGNTEFCPLNVTIEGIGEDATIHGFGISIRNGGNVEVRNLGILNYMNDGLNIYSKNRNIWAHDLDISYGQIGVDDDQIKGDGAIDVTQTSTYVTVSYVHFVDTGKTSLCGVDETEEFVVTYHHNWFDHSDQRHPLIRLGSVHVYNNYFDGNSMYGVQVDAGSSAFVDSNYFNGCKYPMLSTNQGTKMLGGKEAEEGATGGIIKAYNNVVVGAKSLIYANTTAGATAMSTTDFDAVVTLSRNTKVSSGFVTVYGGISYNNFDTIYDIGVDENEIDAPENVPEIVKRKAGRLNGGDFSWEFTSGANKSSAVDENLRAAIEGYEQLVVSIGGVDKEIVELKELPDDPVEAFVKRMYTVALNREADEAGVTNWVAALNAGTHDGAGIAEEFVLGEEFAMRGLTDEQYVDTLYRTVFGREADAEGKELWLAVLASGQTRAYVLSNFVNLAEFTILCDLCGIERGVMLSDGTAVNPRIPQFVERMYTVVLGRDAENEGLYNNVLALVVGALTAEDVAKNFFTSGEYLIKNKDTESHVTDLYAAFMGREADADGLKFWVSCIEQYGMTRDAVLSEFATSAEFKTIAASYGLQ